MAICVLFRSGYPNALLTAGLLRTSLKRHVPESAQDLSSTSWSAYVLPRPPECQPLLAHPDDFYGCSGSSDLFGLYYDGGWKN